MTIYRNARIMDISLPISSPAKINRLIEILRQEIGQHTILCQNRHQIFRHVLGFGIVLRCGVITPAVVIVQVVFPAGLQTLHLS